MVHPRQFLRSGRPALLALTLLHAVLLLACEGDLPAADPEGGAMPGPPASPRAGVWTATTYQGLPASLVVGDDGSLTDLGVRIKLTYPSGGWCSMVFRSPSPLAIVDDAASFEARSESADFTLPVELLFASDTEATVQVGAFSGQHTVDCGNGLLSGNTSLLKPGSFVIRRTHPATSLAADDTRLSPGDSRPLPVGHLHEACSHQPGSAARVCAFVKYASDRAELWVVDLAKVPAGKSSNLCAASDRVAGCFRLSERLWTGNLLRRVPSFPTSHRFHGDTLVFYADATSLAGAPFTGPVYAWRPGWAAPLRLADDPFHCFFDSDSDAAACLGQATGADQQPRYSELRAGRLGEGRTRLSFIDTVLLFAVPDQYEPGPSRRYQVGFSPGGDYLLWSTRPNDGIDALETLYALRLGEPRTARRQLGVDVTRWQVSRDGQALFWLKTASFPLIDRPRGRLEMVTFPEPSPPRPILTDATDDFVELAAEPSGPRQLVVRTGSQTLMHVWDAEDASRNSQMVDVGVAAIRSWSPGGRVVVYSKRLWEVDSFWGDLHVAVLDRPALVCPVGTEPSWGGVVLSTSGAWLGAFQSTHDPEDRRDLELINSRTCVRWPVATAVESFDGLPGDRFAVLSDFLPLGQPGLVSLGLLDAPDDRRFTVPLTGISGQVALAPATPAGALEVVFSVRGGWRSDGLYRRRLPMVGR